MVITILTGIMLTLTLQTGEASLRQRSMTGVVAEESSGNPQDAAAGLDGRTLVVRLYADWENAPGKFELLSVRVKGNRATIEPDETTVPPIVVVTAEDQEDETVKEAAGATIWAQGLTKELELPLPFREEQDHADQPWLFTDAVGEPLAGATAEIWLADYRGPRIRFGRTTLDRVGRLASKMVVGDLRMVCFVVSHPEYGRAEVGESVELGRKLVAPLVRKGTVAAERAIHGRVVDPNGMPVAGATIICPHVRTLGEGLINGLDAVCKGITDANGVFSFYMPNRKGRDDRGELIPPKSQYYVRIETPKALGLLPYAKPIENGRETLVVLERGDRRRRLRFEDQNGEITDPARLRTIMVSLQRPGDVLWFSYDDWKEGLLLPPGTYHATTRGAHGEYNFAPVELTRQSPETVVFRLPAGVTYYGRVVHGITGRPMPGAFVMAMNGLGADKRLCDLTAEQWDALHSLASDPLKEDAALDPLRRIFSFTKLVRTDGTGSYGMPLEPEEAFHSFVIFEQDYLAVMYRKHSLQADADHFAEVPTMKLFPAATVFVETTVDRQFLSILPRWEIDKESRPAWVEELLGLDDGRESSLEYKDWLRPNARQAVHVPAGVGLRLGLELPSDEELCPILIPQTIYLAQGQTADLGQFTFEPAIPVHVRAVDSTGQAFEGIPIRTVQVGADGMMHWGITHNTDEQGLARFHVIPHSTGSFGVLYHDDGTPLKETVDYQVGGSEDAGREFVLRLSDEMLTCLLR